MNSLSEQVEQSIDSSPGSEPQKGRPFRVCLLGASLDVGNMGCRALTASLVRLIVEVHPEAEISLLYGNSCPSEKYLSVGEKKIKISVVNCRFSPKAKLKEHLVWIFLMALVHRLLPIRGARKYIEKKIPWIGALTQADLVGDIRGGDSFSDIYGIGRIVYGLIPNLIAFLLGKDLVLLPQTYGPFRSSVARWIAKFTFKHASKIYSRDKESIKVVQDLLGKGNRFDHAKVEFCPDVAFCLESVKPDSPAIVPPLLENRAGPLVGLNISGLLFVGGYTGNNMFGLQFDYPQFIQALLARLCEDTGTRVLLIPHVFGTGIESDSKACKQVWEACAPEMRKWLHLVNGTYDQNEIKGIIGRCDFLVGSRMHACIAALSQGIPAVGIAYSRKFVGVFGSAGVGDMVLDAARMPLAEIVEECMTRLKNRDQATIRLAKNIPHIQEEVRTIFEGTMQKKQRHFL